jgi:hypothetical protein
MQTFPYCADHVQGLMLVYVYVYVFVYVYQWISSPRYAAIAHAWSSRRPTETFYRKSKMQAHAMHSTTKQRIRRTETKQPLLK